MLLVIAQSEYAMDKNLQVFNMNLKEQEKYEILNQKIGKQCCLVINIDKSSIYVRSGGGDIYLCFIQEYIKQTVGDS